MTKSKWILSIGDILALAALTFLGFATHGETNLAFLPRMSAIFFPLIIAWFLIAPWLGLFQPEITSRPKQLWRPAIAMLVVAPVAGVLRSLILNTPVIPIFILVLTVTFALGMVIWRSLYYLFNHKMAI